MKGGNSQPSMKTRIVGPHFRVEEREIKVHMRHCQLIRLFRQRPGNRRLLFFRGRIPCAGGLLWAKPAGRVAFLETGAPIVHAPSHRPLYRAIGDRLIALGIATGGMIVLIIAARLPPSPLGHGTHRGLGLPDCVFLQRTGLPCPSCGMTTSFSWFVRGNLLASLYVQPMGAVLAAPLLYALSGWGCISP